MTIPDYQTIMLPLLQSLNDGRDHCMSDLIETIAKYFQVPEAEQEQMLASDAKEVTVTYWVTTPVT